MAAPTPRTDAAPAFPWIGLLVLSGAIFVAVTTEFLPTGLLPDIARSLSVSESSVGVLVSVFAGMVVLTATPLTAITRRVPRKPLVLIVLVVFAISNVIASLAPNYAVLVIARVIGGLASGLFWALVGAYSGHLVPKAQVAKAVAVTSAGATSAFVLGVPVGTLLGHALGWRLAFAVIAAAVVVFALLVLRFLPRVTHLEELTTGEIPIPLRKDPSVRGVVLVCLTVVIMMMGHNVFYTYIAPWIIDVAGFPEANVGGLLFAYGAAGAVGLLLAGFVGAKYPRVGLIVFVVLIGVVVLVLAFFHDVNWIVIGSLFAWGVVFGGAPAILQTRLLHVASARIRDVSSAYFTTSFNIAIGGGALLGGFLLDRFGLPSLPFADFAFVVATVLLLVGTELVQRRRSRI